MCREVPASPGSGGATLAATPGTFEPGDPSRVEDPPPLGLQPTSQFLVGGRHPGGEVSRERFERRIPPKVRDPYGEAAGEFPGRPGRKDPKVGEPFQFSEDGGGDLDPSVLELTIDLPLQGEAVREHQEQEIGIDKHPGS